MKNIGIIMLLFIVSGFAAQNESVEPKTKQQNKKVETVTVLTSAICGECKERIENELNYTKGIIFAELNIDTKMVEVKYKTKFLNADGVKKVINDLGYDADKSKRSEEAFQKLPKCCQSPGHCSRD